MIGVDFALGDPRELVVVGEADDPTVRGFLQQAWRAFPPDVVVMRVGADNAEALSAASAIAAGKTAIDGKPAAYVCRRGACQAPVTAVDELVLR